MFPKLFFLSTYGLMVAIGAFTAIWIFDKNRKYASLSENHSTTIALLALLSGIAGARIYYIIQFYDEHFKYAGIWKMFKIWEGGLVFYGGPLLALAVIFIYCRTKKISFISVLDLFAPAIAVAHAFGRVGCFLHGCCVSTVACSYPWAVTYPAGSAADTETNGAAVHPVQLYETLFNLILAVPLFMLVRKGRKGTAAGTYMICYGLWRFVIEFWRNEPKYWLFSSAQYISMTFMLAGLALLTAACFSKPAREQEDDEEC